MNRQLLYAAAALVLVTFAPRANADSYQFSFTGPGVSGTIDATYGAATDATYPQAYEVTGISGTFSDTNIGITNASITGLVPINHAPHDPTNLLTPYDFSSFPVATGTQHGSISFDNLFYPGGSPQTATDYMFSGGFLDIYGLLFDIGNNTVANIWSNGVLPGTDVPDYGVAVATSASSLDYIANGVAPTPEPGTLCLLGTGALGIAFRLRPSLRRSRS